MKSLKQYIDSQNMTESYLFMNYGKDIDSVLFKFETYTKQRIFKNVYESKYDIDFTINEQYAVNNLFRLICEDYRDKLLEELNVFEDYFNGQISINEAELKLVSYAKEIWNEKKDKVKQAYEKCKTKIKEINDLIKEFSNKAITSVKDMANKIMAILEKFNCTIEELFKKMGFSNIEEEEKEWMAASEDIVNNIERLKSNNIYETFGNQLKDELINEKNKEENNEENKSNVVKQADKKGVKQMLKKAFKQMCIWAMVCVAIPGFVCAYFPGTFLALLVPIVCKLACNGYKIVKLWKQFKTIKKEWDTYSKVQKWITVIGIIASIIALGLNFNSIIGDGGKMLSAFSKTSCDLLAKANLGTQPDVLTRGFAAFISWLKGGKFGWDDLGAAYKSITDSFAEHTELVTEKITKVTAKIGKSGKELLDEFEGSKFKSSSAVWKYLHKSEINPSEITDKGVYDVVLDGHSDANWFSKLNDIAQKAGVELKPDNALNKGLNAICNNAGSLTGVKMPGKLLKYLIDNNIDLGHNSFKAVDGIMKGVSIIGGSTDTSEVISTVTDVIKAASSMLITIPSVEFAFQNNGGFQVRLGEEGSNNFIYQVDENGVRTEDFKDTDKIKELVSKTEEYYKTLENSAESDEDKEKVKEEYEKFKEKFNSDVKNLKRIVFYGKKIEDDSKNESRQYISLAEYILEKKEYNIENPDKETIFKNLDDLRKLIESKCPGYTKQTDINNKQIIQKSDSTLAGSTQIILRSIFSSNQKNKTSTFEWDNEFTPDKNELAKTTIKKRATTETTEDDKFGPEDVARLASFLQKNLYKDTDTETLSKALIDVIIIKTLLRKSSEITETIKASYKQLVDNFSKSETFKKDLPEEWIPGKNWAPLFKDVKVNDEEANKIKETENNNIPSEQEIEEIEDEVNNTDNTDNTDSTDNNSEENTDEKEIEILEFIPFFNGWDIADADKNGPRKEPYSLKGCFTSLEFIAIEKGTSIDNIEKMLGELLFDMVNNCYNLIADKPCIKDGDKFKINENSSYKENDERSELGDFTNAEITDILNNKDNAKKYLSILGSKIKIAKTKKEEEQIKELEKKNESIKNSEELKKLKPELYDKEGNIKEEEWKKFNSALSNYQLGKHKSKKSKGFFAKLWDSIKSLFGFKTDDLEKANELVVKSQNTNESLEIFNKRLSLSEYIKLH